MERDSFTKLFRMVQPSLYRYLYRMCGSKESAEELLQETFYRAMLSLQLDDTKMARAWLYRVARNLFIDWLRKQKVEARMMQHIEYEATGISPYPTPEEALQAQEKRRNLSEVMNALPERYRTILYLREIEGFSYQELAGTLDISIDQVKVNLHRSRHKFKELASAQKGDHAE